ncbi:MAG: hypothetical protein ACKVQA_01700, partial [Burkholderiales bacterium]
PAISRMLFAVGRLETWCSYMLLLDSLFAIMAPRTSLVLAPAPSAHAALSAKPSNSAAKSSALRSPAQTTLASLKSLAQNAEYEAFRQAWRVALNEGDGGVPQVSLYKLLAETELAAGDHERLAAAARVLIDEFGAPEGGYYQAHSDYLHAQYASAIERLQCVVYQSPDYVEAATLLAKCFRDAGQSEAAWRSLESLLPKSDDLMIWSAMASLVQSQTDFTRLLGHFQKRQVSPGPTPGESVVAPDKHPLEYLALGALRTGNFTLAKSVWQDLLRHIAGLPPRGPGAQPTAPEYSSRRAQLALIDLKRTLQAAEIPMFLVSGTLLGCVREGRLLGHDHDVDVGIWDEVNREHLLSVLLKSGLFYDQASRAPEIVRLKHVNGIVIDMFYHFRSPGDYWHRGVKIIWHNTPFKLAVRNFLGEEFLIPEDYDTYLTENYGDWRTPKIDFDCAFDTPNAQIANRDELLIHTYKMLGQAMAAGALGRAAFFLARLREMGVKDFADALSKQLRLEQPS